MVEFRYRGREISQEDILYIRALIDSHPNESRRTRLAGRLSGVAQALPRHPGIRRGGRANSVLHRTAHGGDQIATLAASSLPLRGPCGVLSWESFAVDGDTRAGRGA